MITTTDDIYMKINGIISDIIRKAEEMEVVYKDELKDIHPIYRKSAANLLHYLAFRSFDIDRLQLDLRTLGLPSLTTIEGHVMRSLFKLQNIILKMLNMDTIRDPKGYVSIKKSEKILRKNTQLLFGYRSKKRRTRIMVTLPAAAAEDLALVQKLIKLGMNCVRINCAQKGKFFMNTAETSP